MSGDYFPELIPFDLSAEWIETVETEETTDGDDCNV
jgi:hypothetical protein